MAALALGQVAVQPQNPGGGLMTWAVARTALATKLAAVAITDPISASIQVAYEHPPSSITNDYAFALFPPAIDVERHPGGWRRNTYTYRARLFVYDSQADLAAEVLEAFVEATIVAFDDSSTERVGEVQIVNGPRVEEPGPLRIGPRTFLVADMFFDVQRGESATFG